MKFDGRNLNGTEQAAALIYEAETGRDWSQASEEERAEFLRAADQFQDAVHGTWPSHLSAKTVH